MTRKDQVFGPTRGPAAVLGQLQDRMRAGQIALCEHATPTDTTTVYWTPSSPDTLWCEPCVLLVPESLKQARTCNGCGRERNPIETVEAAVLGAESVTTAPIIAVFRLCATCG